MKLSNLLEYLCSDMVEIWSCDTEHKMGTYDIETLCQHLDVFNPVVYGIMAEGDNLILYIQDD